MDQSAAKHIWEQVMSDREIRIGCKYFGWANEQGTSGVGTSNLFCKSFS